MTQAPIRVVQIIAGFAVERLGGIERYGVELARHMDRRAVQPILCALWAWGTSEEGIWRRRLEEEGIPTVVAAEKNDVSPYRNYVNVIRGIQAAIRAPVGVLHSHSEFGDPAALWLRRKLGAQAVVRTVHNEREWPRRPLRRLLLTHLFYPFVFDVEMGVSRQVVHNLDRRPLARLLGRQAQVMYNSLDFKRFENRGIDRLAKRAELHIAADTPVIGTVGRLTEQKGYDVLMEAIPAVLAQRPDACFLIVGEGHLRASLEQKATELGIAHAVRFLGRRTDVEELLFIFDLFVSASRWEGLPTVLLESIAAKIPVIATKVSGTVELVQEGVNGLLAPPEDAEALGAAMNRVLGDLEAFRRGAAQARGEIEAVFSMESVAQKHAELYRSLVSNVAKKSL